MESERSNDHEKQVFEQEPVIGSRIGQIHGSDERGRVLVVYDGREPVPSRLVAGLSHDELSGVEYRGREVLLSFDGGNPLTPIITNLMSLPLESLVEMEVGDDLCGQPQDAVLDGKRVHLDAEEEVILSCGAASITLKRDGRVIIKGDSIVSRARGLNHIEGGATRVY